MPKRLLVTGSSGLIGAEVCRHFSAQGFEIHGLDITPAHPGLAPKAVFTPHRLDLRAREAIIELVREVKPYGIVHAAGISSPDWATEHPAETFDINLTGTLNLLEGVRRFAPESPFIFISSNQVYGDRPNTISLTETETRFDIAAAGYAAGIQEDFPVDHSTHTVLGTTKVAADFLVQDYSRAFHIPTCCLRAGTITGPGDHGFFGQLVRANLEHQDYVVPGYQGKQVRDILHVADAANLIYEFYERPGFSSVYNIGGGPANACSLLEAFQLVERTSGHAMKPVFLEKNRIGDRICYYSDLTAIQKAFPRWKVTRSLGQIVTELVSSMSTQP